MMTLISAAMLLIAMNNASGSSLEPTASVQWPAGLVLGSPDDETAAVSSLLRSLNSTQSRWTQASQAVFIVPGPDLPAENLAQITEDLMVMCRILDRAVAPALPASGPTDILGSINEQTPYGRSQTQALYLDEYGALFFVEVGFPLVRPPQEQEQPKTEPSGDSVWSQAADELKGIPPKQSGARAPSFDAQKVENLKVILIKSLRHAANLRVRGQQDRIVLVVTSRGPSGSYAYATTRFRSMVRVGPTPSTSSDVLILGTTKSDVDAFAKGNLTLEQFTEKVSALRSWTSSIQQQSTPTRASVPGGGISTGVQR